MKVVYFTYNTEKKFIGEEIAQKLNVEFQKLPIELWEEQADMMHEASLILIEHSSKSIVLENIVRKISSHLGGLTSCIILTEDMDFNSKINYYNLGVSAVIETNEQLEDELYQYFLFAWKEFEIITYLQNMQIAVVDDSRFSLEVIKSYFERCHVNNVQYFQEAKVMLDEISKYDLFIIDLVMPKFSGQELIRCIKRQNKQAIVIIVTTYGEGISIPHGMNIGADDFLIKPFNFNLFLLRLTACIRNKILNAEKHENAKMLYELATKDSLTNLYNRRFFVDFLEEQIKEARREERTFSMILFDLDHFKIVNDEHGHLVGDKVLRKVAQTVQNKLRESDIVCRWGGEEFAVFLSGTNLEYAGIVAEKLRQAIEKMKIKSMNPITASFGVTQWLEEDDAITIFQRVDNSLYLAKLTGRNKVVSNEEVFIYKGGLPVSIEWGPFFRSGHQQVDSEHNVLISLSNELIINCFIEDNRENTEKIFQRIIEYSLEHFANEEEILQDYAYSELEEHKQIHQALIKRAKNMMVLMHQDGIGSIDLAKYIVQEVIIGHIIKYDFKFFDLFTK